MPAKLCAVAFKVAYFNCLFVRVKIVYLPKNCVLCRVQLCWLSLKHNIKMPDSTLHCSSRPVT